jgi:septal ring factor EnvC (AmiA/AmiB activator)
MDKTTEDKIRTTISTLNEAIDKRWQKIESLEKDIKNHRYHIKRMHLKQHELMGYFAKKLSQ